MSHPTWRDAANRVLGDLFAGGHEPTAAEIFDAYPFGERGYHPYKVWCEQVRCWREFRQGRPPAKRARIPKPIPEGQAVLL